MFSEPHIQDPLDWVPTDCRGDGCGECEVCEYLDFIEYAVSCAPPGMSVIERDPLMEAYIKHYYGK